MTYKTLCAALAVALVLPAVAVAQDLSFDDAPAKKDAKDPKKPPKKEDVPAQKDGLIDLGDAFK